MTATTIIQNVSVKDSNTDTTSSNTCTTDSSDHHNDPNSDNNTTSNNANNNVSIQPTGTLLNQQNQQNHNHNHNQTNNHNQQRLKRKYRTTPYPYSILDEKELLKSLQKHGLIIVNTDSIENNLNENYNNESIVKPIHITGFYQALHRQHYPSLSQFVINYYSEEEKYNNNNNNNNNSNAGNDLSKQSLVNKSNTTTTTTTTTITNYKLLPIKNTSTIKKNYNKIQLPKQFLNFLITTKDFVTITSTIIEQQTSLDKTTTKLIIQLHDGQKVESVLMRYYSSNTNSTTTNNNNTHTNSTMRTSSRASLCISSQCGCAMGCTFCATGTMGLTGNLTTGEILEQIIHADRILANEWIESNNKNNNKCNSNNDNNDNNNNTSSTTTNKNIYTSDMIQKNKDKKKNKKKKNNNNKDNNMDLIRNVVFMGMGEPLDNYTNVVTACRALIDKKRWNLAHGRVTVSTVGIISKIRKLTAELPEVSLAVSLHAPNQEMRQTIVPTAKQYPIQQLIDALDGHMMSHITKKHSKNDNNNRLQEQEQQVLYTVEQRVKESSRRRAMIEYVMISGPTSTIQAAHELGQLCKGKHLVINLIPYNQTNVNDPISCPSTSNINEFKKIVASYGTFCTIRRTMGADIDSACGQLITKLDYSTSTDENNNNSTSSSKTMTTTKSSNHTIRDIEDVVVKVTQQQETNNKKSAVDQIRKRQHHQQQQTISTASGIVDSISASIPLRVLDESDDYPILEEVEIEQKQLHIKTNQQKNIEITDNNNNNNKDVITNNNDNNNTTTATRTSTNFFIQVLNCENLIHPLQVAITIAATSFVVSTLIFVISVDHQQRRRIR